MKSEVTKELEKGKEAMQKRRSKSEIANHLVANTDIPVPARLLEKRVEEFVQEARSRMKTGALTDEQEGSFNAALSKEYGPEAEKRIKIGIIFGKIAEKEGIKVDDARGRRALEENCGRNQEGL